MNKDLKICFIPLILFVLIGFCVCLIPQVTVFDTNIDVFLQSTFSFISLDKIDFISGFNHNYGKAILFIGILFLAYKKDLKLAIMYFACNYSAHSMTLFVKDIIQRHRPPFELQQLHHLTDFSFPSGHSYSIMLLLGLMIYIVCKHTKNVLIKNIIIFLCSAGIILVGWSRLMLGEHYPSDVLGGFLYGLFIICVVRYIDKKEG